MTLHKCPHSVYVPADIQGDESPYCSFCKTGQRMLALRDTDERESDEVKKESCPICSSKDFMYDSEDIYYCNNCGFGPEDIY